MVYGDNNRRVWSVQKLSVNTDWVFLGIFFSSNIVSIAFTSEDWKLINSGMFLPTTAKQIWRDLRNIWLVLYTWFSRHSRTSQYFMVTFRMKREWFECRRGLVDAVRWILSSVEGGKPPSAPRASKEGSNSLRNLSSDCKACCPYCCLCALAFVLDALFIWESSTWVTWFQAANVRFSISDMLQRL